MHRLICMALFSIVRTAGTKLPAEEFFDSLGKRLSRLKEGITFRKERVAYEYDDNIVERVDLELQYVKT